VRTFEIKQSEINASGMPASLRATLDSLIEATRSENIEDVYLLMEWSHSRCIDNIVNVLSILPIPIHLVPDQNVARFAGRPMVQLGATWAAELKRAPLTQLEQALKRALDLAVAGAGIVMLCPLMLVT